MTGWWRFTALGVLTAGMMLACGTGPGMAQSRAHVYLLRGLLNIFSLGMDTLCDELNRRGVYATVDNHADWQELADAAAAKYRAGTEGPIILIGHSLGADAVMEMAAYLGRKGVPVALVVPFDGTDSYAASANVARVLNLTKHYYMSRGPGFHGSLLNVDLRNDANIDHLNIDKSPRLHARVIAEVLALVGARRTTAPSVAAPSAAQADTHQRARAERHAKRHDRSACQRRRRRARRAGDRGQDRHWRDECAGRGQAVGGRRHADHRASGKKRRARRRSAAIIIAASVSAARSARN